MRLKDLKQRFLEYLKRTISEDDEDFFVDDQEDYEDVEYSSITCFIL